ncbi:hypothetical protein Gorai_003230 [Gossypium raimondii]|uniref:Peptidase S26 domain-containing protein n=1 Tax=Gossypium raimondii TaxID=29730 RepID=A0A7J8QNC4_GOSRA|nr:hypothetical protein [Gossypium raimondii]
MCASRDSNPHHSTHMSALLSEWNSALMFVPKGHVWIQGDNLYVSRDSRHFGPLPYGLIEGKVFMRVSTANSIAFGFVHKNELKYICWN